MLADYRHLSLPDGWTDTTIGAIAKVVGGGTPSTANKSYWHGDVPWATPTDITGLQTRFIDKTVTNISPSGLKKSGAYLLPAGSLLMTSRATIGACAINKVPMATNQGFANAVCSGVVDVEFLYYLLSARKHELTRLASGSTFAEMPKSEFRSVRIMAPPESEQKKIVSILTAVDEAIEQTRAVIDQARRLKSALLQDLFTHGLPGGHTEFVKHEKFGTIPSTWKVLRLKDLVARWQYGLCDSLEAQGMYACLRMNNYMAGRITDNDIKYVNIDANTFDRYKLDRGDILFNRTNSRDLVGKVGIFDLTGSYVFASYLVRMKATLDIVRPEFLNQLLNSADNQRRIKRLATPGVSQSNINVENLKRLAVALPSIHEQDSILALLTAMQKLFEAMDLRLAKLTSSKTALSQALLTGRLRLSPSRRHRA